MITRVRSVHDGPTRPVMLKLTRFNNRAKLYRARIFSFVIVYFGLLLYLTTG